jgi:hypothetical protein
MIFLFFTSQKKELRKSFRPFFGPYWQIFDNNSAASLLGRTYFLPAPFELCGRKFGQLATLELGVNHRYLYKPGSIELFLERVVRVLLTMHSLRVLLYIRVL